MTSIAITKAAWGYRFAEAAERRCGACRHVAREPSIRHPGRDSLRCGRGAFYVTRLATCDLFAPGKPTETTK